MALTDEQLAMFTEQMKSSLAEPVLKRLDSFGYAPVETDVFIIEFSIQKVESVIKNDCNVSEIPEGLMNFAVDMICGEFLSVRYRTGQLNIESLDLDGALASVNVGGASVSFDNNSSDTGKFTTLISVLINGGRGEFACYRKIRW